MKEKRKMCIFRDSSLCFGNVPMNTEQKKSDSLIKNDSKDVGYQCIVYRHKYNVPKNWMNKGC